MSLRKRLQRWMPTPESVRSNRSLAFLGPLLGRPWLWNLSRRRVAAGAAIGVFFGFLIPIAQILVAAGAAVLLRANLPVAAVATLVTNPFTFAPVYVAAYYTGAAVLGESANPEVAASLAEGFDASALLQRTTGILKPWFTGLVVFAVGGAAITWLVVNVVWIGAVRLRRRRSARSAAPR
jgi:uncharacterized protein (DUF2062 family)